MTHEEIQQREITEAYVLGRLDPARKAAFEDHCFACDECFENLQTVQQFINGVRDAAETGQLPAPRLAPTPFRMAFAFAAAACLLLAAFAAWSMFVQLPRLEREANRQRQAAELAQKKLGEFETLAMARVPAAQSNLPLLMLTASRAASSNAITIPATASNLALWLEPAPAPANSVYRLQILRADQTPISTIDGLVRNSYGALALSLPSSVLTSGSYTAQLYLMKATKPELPGEYHFDIRR